MAAIERIAYLALGSNLGDRAANLRAALAFLDRPPATQVLAASSFHETAPVGPPQPHYLNAVVEVRTGLEPWALLHHLKGYERGVGRPEGLRWGPRIIDLDILMLGDIQLDEPGLTLPHKEMAGRAFVLGPLMEIAPTLTPPGMALTVRELWEALAQR